MAGSSLIGWGSLIPLVTFLAGFGAKWLEQWFQDRRVTEREREKLAAARRDLLHQRRADFQRENLIALQEAAHNLIRATARAQLHDAARHKAGDKWGITPLGEDIDDSLLEAQRSTGRFGVRILDHSVRDLNHKLKAACAATSLAKTAEISAARMEEAGDVYVQLNERIGEVLRGLELEDT